MRRRALPVVLLLGATLVAAGAPASAGADGVGAAQSSWPGDLVLAGALIGIGTLASLGVATLALVAARRGPGSESAESLDDDRQARAARARRHLDDDPIIAAMGLGDAEDRRARRAPPGSD